MPERITNYELRITKEGNGVRAPGFGLRFPIRNWLFALLLYAGICDAQPTPIECVNLGPAVNSAGDDYGGVLTSTGDTLIFTTSRPVSGKLRKGLNAELMQTASRHVKHCETRDWGEVHIFDSTHLEGVHLNLNEGTLALSHDRTFAIFAAERILGENGQSAYQDLYQIALDANGRPTGRPQPLTQVNDPDAWDSQPALSPDDNWLFFVSDRLPLKGSRNHSTHGHSDLYYARRMSDGSWSAPTNAGPTINTEGDEVSPFVAQGDTLYFASDGNPDGKQPGEGQGMRDIFRAHFTWARSQVPGTAPATLLFTAPVRLEAPYNSPQNDEFPFISDNGRYFLLSSDRTGGYGKLDLYMACNYTPPLVTLCGRITERPEDDKSDKNAQPLATTIFLRDETIGKSASIVTNEAGRYCVRLLAEHHYTIYPDSLQCFHAPATQYAFSPLPDNDTTLHLNFEYLSIRERIGLRTDTVVPFFVTGYWYPNTPANFDTLLARQNDLVQHGVHYIYPVWQTVVEREKGGDSIDYQKTSSEVERLLERSIYRPIEDMLSKMFQTSCNDSGLILRISVTGFTDERSLLSGPYRDEPVVIDGVKIDTTMQMNQDAYPASPGNRFLSKLRAYFTVKTIDRDLMERSPEYRRMKSEHRVVFSAHGEDVDQAGKPQAFKRRVDIQVALVHPLEARQVLVDYPFVNQALSKP